MVTTMYNNISNSCQPQESKAPQVGKCRSYIRRLYVGLTWVTYRLDWHEILHRRFRPSQSRKWITAKWLTAWQTRLSLIYLEFRSKPSLIAVICMDPHSPNKLSATKYFFLILGDDASFFFLIIYVFFVFLLFYAILLFCYY